MGVAAFAFCAVTSRAEIPRAGLPQNTLQSVLDRIHDHATNDAWKQPGFQDEAVEKWLDKIVGSVAKAAEFPELTLPVRFSEMKAAAPAVGRQILSALVIGRDLDFKDASLKKSIILADGSVTVM